MRSSEGLSHLAAHENFFFLKLKDLSQDLSHLTSFVISLLCNL